VTTIASSTMVNAHSTARNDAIQRFAVLPRVPPRPPAANARPGSVFDSWMAGARPKTRTLAMLINANMETKR
jgi:hypothetical protein